MTDDDDTLDLSDEYRKAVAKEPWIREIDASQLVLGILWEDHHNYESPLEDRDMTEFHALVAEAKSPWHEKPLLNTYVTINQLAANKLAKTFKPVPAAELAHYFGRDQWRNVDIVDEKMKEKRYFNKDIIDVLTNPETPPETYPTSIPYFACHFINAISRLLPEEFWTKTVGREKMKLELEDITNFLYEQDAKYDSPLKTLYNAQKMQLIMTDIAEQLRVQSSGIGGLRHMITIAECFAQKGEAISNDIIARVEQSFEHNQTLDFGQPPPPAP